MAAPVEQRFHIAAQITTRGRQRDDREKRPFGHANFCVGRSQLALGGGDIRAAFKEAGRQAGGNGGRLRVPDDVRFFERGQFERGGIFADEKSNGIFHFVALMGQRGGFGLGGGQFGQGLRDIQFTADAAFKTAAYEAHLFISQIHGAGHGGDFGVQRTQGEIILCDVRLKGEQDVVIICERRLGVVPSTLKAAPHAAPEVNFIAQIQRSGDRVGSNAAKVRHGVGRIALPGEARIQTEIRHQIGAGHAGGGARLLHAGDGGLEPLIRLQGL